MLVRFACVGAWCVDSRCQMLMHWICFADGMPDVIRRGLNANWLTKSATRVDTGASRSADYSKHRDEDRFNSFVDVHAPHRPCTLSLSHAPTSARATSSDPS